MFLSKRKSMTLKVSAQFNFKENDFAFSNVNMLFTFVFAVLLLSFCLLVYSLFILVFFGLKENDFAFLNGNILFTFVFAVLLLSFCLLVYFLFILVFLLVHFLFTCLSWKQVHCLCFCFCSFCLQRKG